MGPVAVCIPYGFPGAIRLLYIRNQGIRKSVVNALGWDPISSVVTELLAAGIEHHRAGRLAEAEACYRRVLAAQPSHFEAYLFQSRRSTQGQGKARSTRRLPPIARRSASGRITFALTSTLAMRLRTRASSTRR